MISRATASAVQIWREVAVQTAKAERDAQLASLFPGIDGDDPDAGCQVPPKEGHGRRQRRTRKR